MDYTLVIVFAVMFVLAIFWFVSKTVGQLPVVKNSPTLDDLHGAYRQDLTEEQQRQQQEYRGQAGSLSQTVRSLADDGQKLEAIKAYMGESGAGLLDAKNVVEAYMSRRPNT